MDPSSWTEEQVAEHLHSCGAGLKPEVINKLQEEEVDGAALLLLTQEQLASPPLGFKVGTITKLIHAVDRLREASSAAAPHTSPSEHPEASPAEQPAPEHSPPEASPAAAEQATLPATPQQLLNLAATTPLPSWWPKTRKVSIVNKNNNSYLKSKMKQ